MLSTGEWQGNHHMRKLNVLFSLQLLSNTEKPIYSREKRQCHHVLLNGMSEGWLVNWSLTSLFSLQCFDAVRWAAGRASSL